VKRRRTYVDYLRDILEAVEKAQRFVGEMDLDIFLADEKTSFAVVRALEIIGEATKNVPQHVRDRYPDIPWREMAGMRDKLAHAYFGVDLRRTFEVVHRDIPRLEPLIRSALEKERTRSSDD